jgi:GTP 3',8-cyclase
MDHYLRMIRIFVSLGVEKVRITGGEPLLRKWTGSHGIPISGDADSRCEGGRRRHHHQRTPARKARRVAKISRVITNNGEHGRSRSRQIRSDYQGAQSYDAVVAGIRAALRVGLRPLR